MINFFNELISMAFDASVLIVVVIAIRFCLKKMPKYFRKILWGLVGIRLLVPVSLESAFSLMPKVTSTQTQAAVNAAPVIDATSGIQPQQVLPYVWLSICVILSVYGVVSFVKLKYQISDAVLDKNNIYLSEKIDSPFVCGFIKPKIYLPYNINNETKACVLQHEMHHIKCGDHIFKAIGFLLVCVYWFNPLVWAAYFLFCKDIELACDENVIKDYTDEKRKEYASAILELGVSKVKLSACPVAFGEVGIKERVVSAVNYKKVTKAFLCLCVALCVAVALCFMTEPKAKAVEKTAPEKTEKVSVTQAPVPTTTEPTTTQKPENVTKADKEETTKSNTSTQTKNKNSKNKTEKKPDSTKETFTIGPIPEIYFDYETGKVIVEPQTEPIPETTSREMEAILKNWNARSDSNGSNNIIDNGPLDFFGENEATTGNPYEITGSEAIPIFY